MLEYHTQEYLRKGRSAVYLRGKDTTWSRLYCQERVKREVKYYSSNANCKRRSLKFEENENLVRDSTSRSRRFGIGHIKYNIQHCLKSQLTISTHPLTTWVKAASQTKKNPGHNEVLQPQLTQKASWKKSPHNSQIQRLEASKNYISLSFRSWRAHAKATVPSSSTVEGKRQAFLTKQIPINHRVRLFSFSPRPLHSFRIRIAQHQPPLQISPSIDPHRLPFPPSPSKQDRRPHPNPVTNGFLPRHLSIPYQPVTKMSRTSPSTNI